MCWTDAGHQQGIKSQKCCAIVRSRRTGRRIHVPTQRRATARTRISVQLTPSADTDMLEYTASGDQKRNLRSGTVVEASA